MLHIDWHLCCLCQVLSLRHCQVESSRCISPVHFPLLLHLDVSWTQVLTAGLLQQLAYASPPSLCMP